MRPCVRGPASGSPSAATTTPSSGRAPSGTTTCGSWRRRASASSLSGCSPGPGSSHPRVSTPSTGSTRSWTCSTSTASPSTSRPPRRRRRRGSPPRTPRSCPSTVTDTPCGPGAGRRGAPPRRSTASWRWPSPTTSPRGTTTTRPWRCGTSRTSTRATTCPATATPAPSPSGTGSSAATPPSRRSTTPGGPPSGASATRLGRHPAATAHARPSTTPPTCSTSTGSAPTTLLDFFRAEREVIRRHSPDVPVTTNFMTLSRFRLLDYHDWAPFQDVVSTDHYVVDALAHPRASCPSTVT